MPCNSNAIYVFNLLYILHAQHLNVLATGHTSHRGSAKPAATKGAKRKCSYTVHVHLAFQLFRALFQTQHDLGILAVFYLGDGMTFELIAWILFSFFSLITSYPAMVGSLYVFIAQPMSQIIKVIFQYKLKSHLSDWLVLILNLILTNQMSETKFML